MNYFWFPRSSTKRLRNHLDGKLKSATTLSLKWLRKQINLIRNNPNFEFHRSIYALFITYAFVQYKRKPFRVSLLTVLVKYAHLKVNKRPT